MPLGVNGGVTLLLTRNATSAQLEIFSIAPSAKHVITSTILRIMNLNILDKPWGGDNKVQSGTGTVRRRVSRVANG